jgi:hypothetical protein
MKQRGRRWWAASPGQAGKQAMIEALDFAAHKLIVSTGATKLSSDFAFLGRLDATRPPKQTRPSSLLDNGPIQISKASRAALAVATPSITGTGEAGDTVRLFDGGAPVGSSTVAPGGAWAVAASGLWAGVHVLSATESDGAGNLSAPSAGSRTPSTNRRR